MLGLASKTAKSIHPPVVDLSRRCAKLILGISISFQSCRILLCACQFRQVCQGFILLCLSLIISWTCLISQHRIRRMHELQKKLLRLAQEENLGSYTLRALGAKVGEKSPQKIKHHLGQLEKRGLIRVDRGNSLIEKTQQGRITSLLKGAQLLSIPILGAANAGPANRLADAHIEGYLRISSTFLGSSSKRKLFALKVDGPSMNRAEVDGKRIENGDYVIID